MDYTNLAKRIKMAGADIAKDHTNKDYLLECTYRDTIVVTSDSGFESTAIGDIGRADKGYMYLQKILEEGEGKASYHFCKGVNAYRQVEYFADIVKRMAEDAWRFL